ncbi:hypothetical protein NPIL_380041 [Nephila pilipes]|uniref:Uncharacterized protein n=1 Tax=Nephila pilipes TaxID=299642 RepID=A0A8X6MRF6_NEPPI|nr:hypothetical protein NPIL_380041 [Nephila pilipes]
MGTIRIRAQREEGINNAAKCCCSKCACAVDVAEDADDLEFALAKSDKLLKCSLRMGRKKKDEVAFFSLSTSIFRKKGSEKMLALAPCYVPGQCFAIIWVPRVVVEGHQNDFFIGLLREHE